MFSPETIYIFFQLFLAFFLGAFLGFEREWRRKAAGLRTYSLVALGACLFTVISIYGFRVAGSASLDPSRIASQVVVGIGFIGAGVIFSKGDAVRGLTTAAGLWLSAAIGVAVGVKMFAVAIFATLLGVFILSVLRWSEYILHGGKDKNVYEDN
jgi:putative Mg2+ transporter-C (MgtC) family protein